jgi:protein-disulfide isomerase
LLASFVADELVGKHDLTERKARVNQVRRPQIPPNNCRQTAAARASATAEAAARQGRFWEMHALLFHRQKALEDHDLQTYAGEIGLDLIRFEQDRKGDDVSARVARDVASGEATGVIRGTPTLFIDGVLHTGDYDTATLLEALAR